MNSLVQGGFPVPYLPNLVNQEANAHFSRFLDGRIAERTIPPHKNLLHDTLQEVFRNRWWNWKAVTDVSEQTVGNVNQAF